jgi:hypothetical protein
MRMKPGVVIQILYYLIIPFMSSQKEPLKLGGGTELSKNGGVKRAFVSYEVDTDHDDKKYDDIIDIDDYNNDNTDNTDNDSVCYVEYDDRLGVVEDDNSLEVVEDVDSLEVDDEDSLVVDDEPVSKNKNIMIVLLLFYFINNLFNLRSKNISHPTLINAFGYYEMEYLDGLDNDIMDSILKIYGSSVDREVNVDSFEVTDENRITYTNIHTLLIRFLIAIHFMKKNDITGLKTFTTTCYSIGREASGFSQVIDYTPQFDRFSRGGKSMTKKHKKKHNKTRKHIKKHTKTKHTIRYKTKKQTKKQTKKHMKKTIKKPKNNKTKSNKKPKNRITKKKLFTK